jgi:hypothetical protein
LRIIRKSRKKTDREGALKLAACCRKLYKKRKETAEPVFGIIKQAMGFRQFLLRGAREGKSGMGTGMPEL